MVIGPTLLTGICYCGNCGGAMTIRTGKGGRYRYYACSIRARQGETGCKGRAIPMDKLDNMVVRHIEERLLAPDRLEKLLGTVLGRREDRLYVSYWHHGLFILDISDMSKPRLVSEFNTSPAFPHPTHTCLPMPQTIRGRRILIVADEDVAELWPVPPAFTWTFDITQEKHPVPISTFQVPGLDRNGSPQADMTGCHQPSERLKGTVVPFAWFAQGLRLVDFADPFVPKEVGHFVPKPAPGEQRPSSNDVTLDDRGLIYLVDRVRGISIVESPLFT